MQAEAQRKMTFSLNNEANYDNGLICGGTLEIFCRADLAAAAALYIFGGGARFHRAGECAAHTAGFAIGIIDDRESVRQPGALPDGAGKFTPALKNRSGRSSPAPQPTW